MKYILWGPIDNKPALAHIMACRQTGKTSYLGQGWPGLLTHSGVTQPQLVTSNQQQNRKRHISVSTNRDELT